MDDDDYDIQDLINGGGQDQAISGLNNQELYAKLKNVVKDKEAQQYIEQVDEDGNVYLVEAEEDDDNDDDDYEYGDDDDDGMGGHQIIDGDDIDDEEFLAMMEQEALQQRKNR